jgi:fatty acid desaturase
MKDEGEPSDAASPARRARRTVFIGILLLILCGLVALSPLLLGRGSLNRYIVAFGLAGLLIGGSFVLHGTWDWIAARRG